MPVQIPCLNCRVATLADESAVAVACQRCGAALPAPAQASWSMLRDGAQYGPYTIAEVAAYLADGRMGPTDNIWYPGAAVRLPLSQLPAFGPAAPAPVAPAAPDIPAAAAPTPEPASAHVEDSAREVTVAEREPDPEPAEAASPGPEAQPEPEPAEALALEPVAIDAPAQVAAPAVAVSTPAAPVATAHIPCLSCRATTIAGEDAASVSCSRCGMVLPPPAEAAWFALRDDATYGPYRLADLASWVAEGRIRPQDSIWHSGAAIRLTVSQLPPFGIAPPGMEGSATSAASVQTPMPAPVPVPTPAPVPSADGLDWSSIQVQPGEVVLGSWNVTLTSYDYGVQPGGKLTITDRRLLFKPTVGGRSVIGIAISQTKSFKSGNTIVLNRDRITGASAARRVLNVYVTVTTLDGDLVFNRGPISADAILAALQPR